MASAEPVELTAPDQARLLQQRYAVQRAAWRRDYRRPYGLPEDAKMGRGPERS